MFKNVAKEELTVPAAMSRLREIRDFIEHIGKKYKFTDKVINAFKLVVDESCTNIIRHGYADVKNGKITIRAIIRRLSLTIVIIDQGKSFDPRQVKNPDLKKYVQIGKKGGLGIFMMRKLMDDIQYNLTAHGNELRLTKMRDAVHEAGFKRWWNSQSIRRRYFYSTTSSVVIIAFMVYWFMQAGIESEVRKQVFSNMIAITQNFAEVNWDPLSTSNDISLFENAKSVYESNSDKLEFALLTNADKQILALYPIKASLLYQEYQLNKMTPVQWPTDLSVYRFERNDSTFYDFIAPVRLKSVSTRPIGFAVLRLNNHYLRELGAQRREQLAISVGVLGLVMLIVVGTVVQLITQPLHTLADWVRKVGRGQMDEDEIDIDATDELGQVAQAFSEVTSKFREAQITVIEQQRLQKELQVAQEIQQMLLPDDFPDVIGYDITSYYQSAKEVGGDLFDFMEVDEHSIGICVADVSGKGIPGSLVMTMIRTSLRLETRGNKNPAEILTKVNSFVTDDMRKGMFVTMFYVILDSRERMVWFASAGHNPMILYRGKSKETFYLNPSGFPVGIRLPDPNLFGERIQADRIRLHPDDVLVLYTDGITEAMNPQRELYGEERFLNAIRKYGHQDVVEFVKSVKDDILEFTGGYEQNDDITLVAIKENMAAVDVKVNTFKELFERVHSDDTATVAEACKEAGVSPTTYYRYRRIYNEGGYDLLREMLHGYTNLGLRHLSIEVKTKMYDIIREHPEFGPKKISDLLNTEKYGFTEVSPVLIYEELKRAKLNTKERRIKFVERGGKQRLKAPGTPLLTLDGEVMVGFRSDDHSKATAPFMPYIPQEARRKEKIISARGKRLPGVQDSSAKENSALDEKSKNDDSLNRPVADESLPKPNFNPSETDDESKQD